MRRGLLITAVVLLLATVALWIAARVERSPLARSHGTKRVPDVIAGRDLGPVDAEAPVRTADATATVRCRYDGDGDPGTLLALGAEVVEGNSGGADLSLTVPPGTWTLAWRRADGTTFPLGGFTAEEGDVRTCTLGDEGWQIRGTVRTAGGRPVPDSEVYACGSFTMSDADGAFRFTLTHPKCTVRAVVRDGMLARRGEPVSVGPFDAGPVELVVDDTPIAGMGLAFRMTPEGARVLTVHPGTPADEAGVLEGDLVVSVNGTPTAGLDEDAFIALGTGAEGSRVELVLEQDGDRETVSFRRARLAEPEPEEDDAVEIGAVP